MQGITFENNFDKLCEMNHFINHNSLINRLPGHGFALHVVSSRPGPVQLTPPFHGDGLSQSLVLTFVPDSQLLLHSPYSVQSPHCPSTKIRKQTHWVIYKPRAHYGSNLCMPKYFKFMVCKNRQKQFFLKHVANSTGVTWTGIDIACHIGAIRSNAW